MAGRYERVSHYLRPSFCGGLPAAAPSVPLLSHANQSASVTQVDTHDQDDLDTPISSVAPSVRQRIPNSPPPSFHSRASSLERRRQQNVDATLADAFDADGDDSDDDEPDDRQRLVRQSSFPVSGASATSNRSSAERPNALERQSAVPGGSAGQASSRIYGGGIQSDGVFSNMTARPERGEKIVEEQPPVRWINCPHLCSI